MATTVGFIGVGNMGNPMAGNVLKSGVSMTVFDKHAPAMKNLIDAGAKPAGLGGRGGRAMRGRADLSARVARRGGRVPRRRAASSSCAKPGNVLVDLSSVLPSTPRKIEPRAKARGVHFLESPVSGGVSGARAATLALMVGGDAAVLERVRPVLRAIGPNIFHVGPVGAGNTVKAINNMMACVNSLAMMEGVALGVKAGLDPMTSTRW